MWAEPAAGSGAARPARRQEQPTGQGAGFAARAPCRAHRGAQIEERLVPRPGPAGRQRAIGQRLDLGRAQRAAAPPGQRASDVGVDHGGIGLEGEGQHGPRRVRTDARQLPQTLQRRREAAAQLVRHDPRRRVQAERPAVVAEPAPPAQDLAGRDVGAGPDRREALDEGEEAGHDPSDLGLLQHRLRHEHGPRVTRPPPRQVAPHLFTPGQHGGLVGGGEDAQAQTSCPSYGRRRAGA